MKPIPDAHSSSRPMHPEALPDVQASRDHRRIAIDKVGVKDVRYPITLRMPDGQTQRTVATINMYVSLPPDRKGTHMSRFLEVLNEHGQAIDSMRVIEICRHLQERLEAEDAHIEMEFPYFIQKFAPVTQAPGLMDYKIRFQCCVDDGVDFVMGVTAPATSLCPCSREISAYGAHNQRCEISAEVRFKGLLWIEDLVSILEAAPSTQVYSVLKRPDEKFVTEEAYDNPKFVEDIIRDLAMALNADERITWYRIQSLNYESIHSHNAYAQITRDKREG
jgi:GTP cyclohydrolase I